MQRLSNRARLMAGGALAAFSVSGYAPRGAYAGTCDTTDPLAITCSGAADPNGGDAPQILRGNDGVSVTTTPGFGLNTDVLFLGAFDAFLAPFSAPAPFTFVDDYASSIRSALSAITVAGNVSTTSITSSGELISDYGFGVSVAQTGTASLTLNDVSSAQDAVRVTATGTIEINASGSIVSTDGDGVFASSGFGPIDVTVGEVDGLGDGIDAYAGSGAVWAIGLAAFSTRLFRTLKAIRARGLASRAGLGPGMAGILHLVLAAPRIVWILLF
ncbi:MAG: hypothetical protein AAFU55_04045, partial [Pseudomonadota bacterium]